MKQEIPTVESHSLLKQESQPKLMGGGPKEKEKKPKKKIEADFISPPANPNESLKSGQNKGNIP